MTIRPVKISDADAMLGIYKPYIENTPVTFEMTVPTVDEFATRIKTFTERYPWLVAEEQGQVVGYAYATRHREREAYQWCVESSVYVLEEYHRKGIAKKLYSKLFDILRSYGYVNVYAGITLPNEKSVSFHTRMGFETVGVYRNIGYKLGKWHDVFWMVKTINEHRSDPPAPTRL